MALTRSKLERIRRMVCGKERREKDPVRFVHAYRKSKDQELAGFIASVFAYGRVEQILKSVAYVLEKLGPDLAGTIRTGRGRFSGLFKGFKHRLNKETDLVLLLLALSSILKEFGTLEKYFIHALGKTRTLQEGLSQFVDGIRNRVCQLSTRYQIPLGYVMHLLPSPEKKGACKRMNLFLRWMIRKDEIDPGTWHAHLSHLSGDLVIPLDVHISRQARRHGMTNRRTQDWKTAEEITAYLRRFDRRDPLRYDFPLCHIGMLESRKKVRIHA